MRIVGNAICEGPAGHVVIAPFDLWPLLRCLALLSPSSDTGGHLARRSVEQALLELSSFIFSADGRSGARFGAVTVGTESLSLSDALTSVLPLWRSFLDGLRVKGSFRQVCLDRFMMRSRWPILLRLSVQRFLFQLGVWGAHYCEQ